MELLLERAEIQAAPTSNEVGLGNKSADHAAMLHSAPAPIEQAWPDLWVLIAAAIALVLKVVIAFNTFGTNDVVEFYRFAAELTHDGLEQTYLQQPSFNHPSVVAHYLTAIYGVDHQPFAQENGITFPFLLRLPGIVADFVVVSALLY